MNPLISIIMPVYNASAFIKEAIDSVIVQDYENWELIVVNDGSTDDSLSIAMSYRDQRIKLHNQANAGVSRARNAALSIMRGDFFCFLDADDVLPSTSLSSRLQCFESDDICFVDGTVEIFNSDLTIKKRTWRPRKNTPHFKSLVRLDGHCFFGPTWMIRRNASVLYRFDVDLTHGEDLLFFMSYAHLGSYTFCVDAILRYRESPSSAMRNNYVGLARGYALIRRKIGHLPSAVSWLDKVVFDLKRRKSIFLLFLRSRKPLLATRYLLIGNI